MRRGREVLGEGGGEENREEVEIGREEGQEGQEGHGEDGER